MKLLFALLGLITAVSAFGQTTDTVFIEKMLKANPDLFAHVLNQPMHNEVQILYTRIDRDRDNIPHFTSYTYRLNPNRYFYPASTVKLPTAVFALEKLNALRIKGLDMNSAMLTDSSYGKQTRVMGDTSSINGKPSIANYIKKILLVSDNDAYNRLYEFVGREELNRKLKKYQLNGTRIMNRLAIGDGGENARHTNQIRFYNDNGLTYTKLPLTDTNNYPMQVGYMQQGKGYLNRRDSLVMQPFDFSNNNIYPLAEQQLVLRRLMFPESFAASDRYNLTDKQYSFLYRYMSMMPTESNKPAYRKPEYFPAYCKFLFYGADSTATIKPNVRIFNKIGDSYGYDIDNAYIVDFKNKVEFMLSAVVQSNEDGIYNDNKYEYDTICLPFLKNLGQVIYQYELKRPKEHLPNLKRFKFNYR